MRRDPEKNREGEKSFRNKGNKRLKKKNWLKMKPRKNNMKLN